MSTKGMSTTAARLLLDRLAPRIDKVLVAHDFDVSGFSIFGTLGSDGPAIVSIMTCALSTSDCGSPTSRH